MDSIQNSILYLIVLLWYIRKSNLNSQNVTFLLTINSETSWNINRPSYNEFHFLIRVGINNFHVGLVFKITKSKNVFDKNKIFIWKREKHTTSGDKCEGTLADMRKLSACWLYNDSEWKDDTSLIACPSRSTERPRFSNSVTLLLAWELLEWLLLPSDSNSRVAFL